jgi:uncharacterized membrane protein
MTKNRLETFSDGVFAIVITLLVLNISIPNVDYKDLPVALLQLVPKLISYVLSFILIGLYWIGHHYYFDKVKQIDGTFLWMNIMLLLFISILPFPTVLLGKYPLGELSLTIYGINLLAVNLVSFLMVNYVHKHKHLANEKFDAIFYKQNVPMFFIINVAYVFAIVFAFIYPLFSYCIFMLQLVFGIKLYVKRMNKESREENQD